MGPELAQKMEEHCKKFGAEIRMEEVLEIYCDGEDRVTRTDENEYRSKVVILSAGGSPIYLEIPGERITGAKEFPTAPSATALFSRTR